MKSNEEKRNTDIKTVKMTAEEE